MVRIDRGEEIIERLRVFAEKEKIDFASVQGLGAVREFTVGVYDAKKKKYAANHFLGSYEIVSLTGTIDRLNGEFYCRLHMSAADGQGRVFGGHLNRAVAGATCEMLVRIEAGSVERKYDEEIGLNLWNL